ncbi:hypothetical protein, conserved [Entamoeba dispar SAW760]|uniref:Isopentenyl phosphate kinase n=1 Tax=Entamoeba dispar (strain ATCC PRA-260 / SAW760) TaxID=370354 RepID=B0EHF8_ENTDS|nr:uncharacterized protein EDI_014040 [Entamoeba dispar SAW760]EDR26024.1 hypothetical protein, conserved [Entamoeba dispar SAW760]|eukprot:EDR26024.1 hypothetical protein, conserved [Entamoeba dispar SAW760]
MNSIPNLIILKIGGSYLTEKNRVDGPPVLENIHVFSKCLAQFIHSHPKQPIILAHGAGSFGHVPAAKYHLAEGFHKTGVIECEMAMQELSSVIVNSLIKEGVSAIPFHPFNFVVTENKRIVDMYLQPLQMMINQGIIPVVHGDIAMDIIQGSCILSADQLVPELAIRFGCSRIGFICNTPVLNDKGEVIPLINEQNYDSIKKFLHGCKGVDVTGGMAGKISELMIAAKKHMIQSYVFEGTKECLELFLEGNDVGTKVCQ